MNKTGLFFGTFNPIHIGHLIIANYMAANTDLNQVWFVISPQNPFKQKKSLLPDYHRLSLLKEAIEDNSKLRASDIEFSLPKPSYTINTLVHLWEKYPQKEFALIMGEDNLRTLKKWKNFEQILERCDLYVYPRASTEYDEEFRSENISDLYRNPRVHLFDVPVMNISSSFIRNAIKENKDIRYMLPDKVLNYIEEMHFYKK